MALVGYQHLVTGQLLGPLKRSTRCLTHRNFERPLHSRFLAVSVARSAYVAGPFFPNTTPRIRSFTRQHATLQMSRPADAFSVAPMMDVTDNHFRTLCRLLSKHALLYTEMVVDSTLVYNASKADHWLAFHPAQQPIVLQLGGSDPQKMRAAAEIAAPYGYSAININCGCPSDRVAGRGCFGAALMKDAPGVAALCRAIAEVVPASTPITVKCRLGVDDLDTYSFARDFVQVVSENAPVRHFIIHARKAYLKGLSPAENRTVPPLRYDRVLALARDFPHLHFSINGGIRTMAQVRHFLDTEHLYGVMVGRAVMNHPWEALAGVDAVIFGDDSCAQRTRRDVLQAYGAYVDKQLHAASIYGQETDERESCSRGSQWTPSLHVLLKPILNLFWGVPRSKEWRKRVQQATDEQTRIRRNSSVKSNFSWETFLPQVAESTLDPWYVNTTWMAMQSESETAAPEDCNNNSAHIDSPASTAITSIAY
jgi:tRNA-dihydrouridine synthase A